MQFTFFMQFTLFTLQLINTFPFIQQEHTMFHRLHGLVQTRSLTLFWKYCLMLWNRYSFRWCDSPGDEISEGIESRMSTLVSVFISNGCSASVNVVRCKTSSARVALNLKCPVGLIPLSSLKAGARKAWQL